MGRENEVTTLVKSISKDEFEEIRCSRTIKRFTVNKDEYEVSKINVNDTLLSYLRQNGQTDVKQMCEEGGCGACSIIEMVNTGSKTGSRAVSSCLVPLAQESFEIGFDWSVKMAVFLK